MLVIKNLTLVLKKDLRVLLEDFSFSLQPQMKAALIGEEGNGKSALLKAIAEPHSLSRYMDIQGAIITAGEVVGYLPQVLPDSMLDLSTSRYFSSKVNWEDFDYPLFYRLLDEMGFPEDRISERIPHAPAVWGREDQVAAPLRNAEAAHAAAAGRAQ